MNHIIKQIELKGLEYGPKLNKNKCELLTTEKKPCIHFEDKTKITKKRSEILRSTPKPKRRQQQGNSTNNVKCMDNITKTTIILERKQPTSDMPVPLMSRK